MGNCTTAESSTMGQRKEVARDQAQSMPPTILTPKTNVILYDEGTGTESCIEVTNLETTVWSTVKGECEKRGRGAGKITFGNTEISKTQTWKQLDISMDAKVIVLTDDLQKARDLAEQEVRDLAEQKKVRAEQSSKLLRKATLKGCDMAGQDLSGYDLSGLVLTGTILNNANLTGTNLTNTQLTGASLSKPQQCQPYNLTPTLQTLS